MPPLNIVNAYDYALIALYFGIVIFVVIVIVIAVVIFIVIAASI